MWGATQIHGNFYPEEVMQPKREQRRKGGLLEGCQAVCHPQLTNIVLLLFYLTPVITDVTAISINAILSGSSTTLFLYSKINFGMGKREYRCSSEFIVSLIRVSTV